MSEIVTAGPRRRLWRKVVLACCILLGTGLVVGIVADNIVLATPSEGTSGESESSSESLLDYFIRHVHAHIREFHRHVHGS